jgi:hypothetical protein
MAHVVYVNHPNNKGMVHNTSCGKYESRLRDRTMNGYWSQTFTTLPEAQQYATSTGKRNVGTCAFCT